MNDQAPSPQAMPEAASTATVTIVENAEVDEQDHAPTLKLKLRKPKPDKKVQWTTETVDNEHMNKKKSKCCCIYHKPKTFDDDSSSDDSDDECEHCHGHVEKKKAKQEQQTVQQEEDDASKCPASEEPSQEPA